MVHGTADAEIMETQFTIFFKIVQVASIKDIRMVHRLANFFKVQELKFAPFG
jgi:hypothetical protein